VFLDKPFPIRLVLNGALGVFSTDGGPTETIMRKDPRIRSAVMFGQGEFNAGVIIDPTPEFQFDCYDRQKFAEFRNLIWYVAPGKQYGLRNH